MSGQLRTLPVTAKKIIEHIIEPTNCDVFISAPSESNYESKLDFLNPVKNNIKDIDIWDDVTLPEKNYKIRPCADVRIQNFLRQLYNTKMGIQLKSKYENQNKFKYDFVIRCRPDVFVVSNHDIENLKCLDNNFLYTCDHDHWRGVSDRLYFSNSKIMDIVDNRLDYVDDFFDSGGVLHAETFFASVISKYKIKIDYSKLIVSLKRDPPKKDSGPKDIGINRPTLNYDSDEWVFYRNWYHTNKLHRVKL